MIKKIFIDTNIWLRFLVADDKEQFEFCKRLLEEVEKGKLRSYTSTIVILEIVYTLTSFYKVSRKQVIADIKDLLATRNLTLIEKTNFRKALKIFSSCSVKLADAIIASQLPDGVILCTCDQEFKKIKPLRSCCPEEILKE